VSAHTPSRILLVEDDPSLRLFYSRALRRAGFTVTLQCRGDAALQEAIADPYDLIILDWFLPGIGGLDVLNGIRAAARSTRVMILSGSGDEVRRAALSAGADHFLPKPCGMDELTQAAADLLRGESRCLADSAA
jgi:DNA-binding response OmpR family regulator